MDKTEIPDELPGSTGRQTKPMFALVTGERGVGKTTLCAEAPAPYFIDLERGTLQKEVKRVVPINFLGVLDAVRKFGSVNHPYKTLVIDTVDALEILIWRKICEDAQIESIQYYAGGYGRGFYRAAEIWREFMAELVALANRYHVLLVSHVTNRAFDDPIQAANYQRFELKINGHAAAAICEPVDLVVFCHFKATIVRDKATKEKHAITGDDRVMYTRIVTGVPFAKNRFNLPTEMPMNWKNLGEKIKAFYTPLPAPKAEPQPESLPE